MWSPYTHMKAKYKKAFDENIHLAILTNTVLTAIEYKNLPDTLPPWLIETIMMTEGTCGVCRMDDGNLYTGTGGYCGDIVNYLPTEYQITNTGVGSKRGKIGVDFAVGKNYSNFAPDWYLMQTASILTEIDVSERCNVLFSRMLRIPKVADGKEKKAVEAGVKAIMEGRFEAVISDNAITDLIDTDKEKFLDLVDVKDVDKLQYLNQYRDNVIKRFFQVYGQGMQTTAKLAQQTTDELHGGDTVSMINMIDKLNCRKRFVEDINDLFNTNITVDFSECWREQQQEMQDLYSTGDPEQDTGEEDTDGHNTDTEEI